MMIVSVRLWREHIGWDLFWRGVCFRENPVGKKLTWLWREARFQGAEIHLCAMRPGHTYGADEASGFRCYRVRPLPVCPTEMLG